MKKTSFFNSLPFKLLVAVILGIIAGLILNRYSTNGISMAVLNITVTIKYILGQWWKPCSMQETAEGAAAAKQWQPQGLFLIQDARSQRCLTYGDRNVWPLHPMTRKRSISPCREHFIQRRKLSMQSVRRWITIVCSVRCTAWKKRA